MLPAIDFHNQFQFKAYEIGNIRINGQLAAEDIFQLSVSKAIP